MSFPGNRHGLNGALATADASLSNDPFCECTVVDLYQCGWTNGYNHLVL